jgi:hypothetical protein
LTEYSQRHLDVVIAFAGNRAEIRYVALDSLKFNVVADVKINRNMSTEYSQRRLDVMVGIREGQGRLNNSVRRPGCLKFNVVADGSLQVCNDGVISTSFGRTVVCRERPGQQCIFLNAVV